MSYNKSEIILLPYEHRFSRRYAEHIHCRGHLGVLSTASKIRTKFWIIKLLKLVKSMRTNCVICKKGTRDYFPSLLIQQKWHTARRNLKVGDVVLIQDSNQIRSQWKLGKVSKAFEGQDGKVRKVQEQYKNPKPGEPVLKYSGRGYVTIERPVNKLVVLLPNDEHRLSA